jgi:pre-mRNA-splicing factor ISY1
MKFIDAGIAPDMKGGAYRYYGAAKKLPGVRELLEASSADNNKRAVRTIEQIQRSIDMSYFGYLDDVDGVLEKLEAVAEKRTLEESIEAFEERKRQKLDNSEAEDVAQVIPSVLVQPGSRKTIDLSAKHLHLHLPSQETINSLILERRKRDLLAQYSSPELLAQLKETEAEILKK